MADDNKQKPEESFKEKILNSLHDQSGLSNQTTSNDNKQEVSENNGEHDSGTNDSDRTTRFSRRIFDDATPLDVDEPISNNDQYEPTVDDSFENEPKTDQSETPFSANTLENQDSTDTSSLHADNDFAATPSEDQGQGTTEFEIQEDINTTDATLNDEDIASVGSRSQSKGRFSRADKTPSPSLEELDQLPLAEKKYETRRKETKVVRRIVLIVVGTLIVLGTIFGITFYNFVQGALEPLDSENSQLVQVNIPSGSSNKEIGDILENDEIIVSGMIFNYWTKFNNVDGFQSGYYQMSPDMTLDEISAMLQEGGTAEPQAIADAKIVIPEGYDISQIAEQIAEATEGAISAEDFLAVMNDEAFFQRMLATYPELLTSASEAEGVRYRLEGYLFPATYDFYADTSTAENLAEQMVAAMYNVLSPDFGAIQNQGVTIQQFLTLASLVEREGVTDADRRNIAQVFMNRINVGMPLQSDISILYALGVHKEVVTYEDLEVDSPYNLYANTGYGPGPFNSPGQASIDATLNPSPNDYYYFVADIDSGEVHFAETYEQHQELVEEYVNN